LAGREPSHRQEEAVRKYFKQTEGLPVLNWAICLDACHTESGGGKHIGRIWKEKKNEQ